jgi:hypothetical protein
MSSAPLTIGIFHALGDFTAARRTSILHATFLERYLPRHTYVYHDLRAPVTGALKKIRFDVVIFDVTFLCYRWVRPRAIFDEIFEKYSFLAKLDAVRAAFPQDEYDHSAILDEWLDAYRVDLVYAVVWDAWSELFPRVSRHSEIRRALTGYVDDDDVRRMSAFCLPFEDREVDVGYRARKLPANFGRHGLLKSTLGDRFAGLAKDRGLKLDVSTRPEDVFLGDDWLKFLGRSKFTLGCEGGSSLIDPRGEIRDRVEAYLRDRPEASFEEVEAACFRGLDRPKPLAAISPRTFEVAAARSGQILVEAPYLGVLRPREHYLPLKPDLSNVSEALDAMSDVPRMKSMIDACWDALIAPDTWRYSTHASEVMRDLERTLEKKGLRPHGGRQRAQNKRLADVHREEVARTQQSVRSRPPTTIAKLERRLKAAVPKPIKDAVRPLLSPIRRRVKRLLGR